MGEKLPELGKASPGLGDRVTVDGDISGVVEEIIFRRNCIRPLYHVCYWANSEQKFITVPESDIAPKG